MIEGLVTVADPTLPQRTWNLALILRLQGAILVRQCHAEHSSANKPRHMSRVELLGNVAVPDGSSCIH